MSESVQSRHFDRTPLTSGLPQLPDILRVERHVSKVPGTDQQRPANLVLLTWSVDPNSIFRVHKSIVILVHATSTTASISTEILKGNEPIPTAQRACRP